MVFICWRELSWMRDEDYTYLFHHLLSSQCYLWITISPAVSDCVSASMLGCLIIAGKLFRGGEQPEIGVQAHVFLGEKIQDLGCMLWFPSSWPQGVGNGGLQVCDSPTCQAERDEPMAGMESCLVPSEWWAWEGAKIQKASSWIFRHDSFRWNLPSPWFLMREMVLAWPNCFIWWWIWRCTSSSGRTRD